MALLINFLGAPCSGKTNTAIRLFDRIKSSSVPCEFVAEVARKYILQKKQELGGSYNTKPNLTDEDQINILNEQLRLEQLYATYSSPDTIIVSDSSPINSMLYVNKEALSVPQKIEILNKVKELNPIVFWTRVVASDRPGDTNRIHDHAFSSHLDQEQLPQLVEFLRNNVGLRVVELQGNRDFRTVIAFNEVSDTLWK